MSLNTLYIYTDASFSKTLNIAIIGHMQLPASNVLATHTDINVALSQISETGNIRAEIRGAITALAAAPRDKKVTLFTDCETISKLPFRRNKLEKSNYISLRKNQILANADLYKEFFLIYDLVQPKLIWVKGHSASSIRNIIEKNFSYLDKTVRKRLRDITSSKDDTN